MAAKAGDPAAVLVLAQIALEHDNLAGAAQLAALVRQSGHREAWLDLIDARLALARQDAPAARQAAVLAMGAKPDNPHLAAQIGVVLARTGLHAEAVALFAQAVQGDPENPDYRYNHAIELQFNGHLDMARSQFAEVVRLVPHHAQAWLALVGLCDDPPQEWRAALEGLFARSEDTQTRLLCGHALARWHEAHGQWDESFVWLERAKAAKAREVAHDRAETEKLFKAANAAASCSAYPALTPSAPRPIFIMGLPRSGTTLVERIIAAHPEVTALGELSDFGIALKRALKTPGAHVLDAPLLEAANRAPDLQPVGTEYLRMVSSLSGEANVFTDKMPFNVFYAPAILRALPQARIVCLRRSPFDVLFANFRQLFATGFSYYSYAFDFGDTAHFIAQFDTLCAQFEASLPPERFLVQRYENLVTNQEAETRRLIEFCGLEWDAACLAPQNSGEAVATASSAQVRAPVHARSVGRWKIYGAASERAVEELARFGLHEEIAGDA